MHKVLQQGNIILLIIGHEQTVYTAVQHTTGKSEVLSYWLSFIEKICGVKKQYPGAELEQGTKTGKPIAAGEYLVTFVLQDDRFFKCGMTFPQIPLKLSSHYKTQTLPVHKSYCKAAQQDCDTGRYGTPTWASN